jgi:HEAT repeat protein
MKVTMKQVLAALDREEPDYHLATRLGPEALPHLLHLVEEGSPGIASKAIYLAGFINTDQSEAVIEMAAHSPDPALRVAAAGALGSLKKVSSRLIIDLLEDPDVGVRKFALKAIEVHRPTDVRAKVQEIADKDPNMMLRQLAKNIFP